MQRCFGIVEISRDEDYVNVVSDAGDRFFLHCAHVPSADVAEEKLPVRALQSLMAYLLNKRIEVRVSVTLTPQEPTLSPIVDIATIENPSSLRYSWCERRDLADQVRDLELLLTDYLSRRFAPAHP